MAGRTYFSKFGDWVKAGVVLQRLTVSLCPAFKVQLQEDGELVLKTIIDHINAQDLGWHPLSEQTIALKGGSNTIYVETGWLKDNLEVRKIRAPADGITLFVGASAWKTHPKNGVKFSDLMIWLEYGTDKMPPRPLIRPSWQEVEPIIKAGWQDLLLELVKTGGK